MWGGGCAGFRGVAFGGRFPVDERGVVLSPVGPFPFGVEGGGWGVGACFGVPWPRGLSWGSIWGISEFLVEINRHFWKLQLFKFIFWQGGENGSSR